MADAGASQRRGTESAITPIGQSSTLIPVDSVGISYYSSSAGPLVPNDLPTVVSRAKEAGVTPIGGFEVRNSSGTYSNSPLGVRSGHDLPTAVVRVKTANSSIGQQPPETSAHGTSYYTGVLGAITPYGSTGGVAPTVTTYKLRAKDTGAGYVEWTTTVTPLTTGSYPGVPVGALTDLTVLSWITR